MAAAVSTSSGRHNDALRGCSLVGVLQPQERDAAPVILAMGLYYYGLRGTNSTYSVVFLNLIPIITSMVAILLRVEKLVFRKWHGKMKLLGIVACIGGTMVVSIYKGKMLHHHWLTHLLRSRTQVAATPAAHHNMVVGTLFLCGSCLGYAF
ncbi:WAT1-related protein At4g08300-like [Aegilops tauschii subsp. strangulata]|uniref:Auxin-induced protein 5NG4 n=1 Tax=Aegilops tauschii TaxID=37682 RepID=M8CR14_AEGTA|nr:WAT1-related protein At1g44800-like [Triticum aestivum]